MSIGHLEARFSSLTQLIRHRLLPQPGEVLVHVGDTVQADDVVAQSHLEGQLYNLDAAGMLGLSVRSLKRHLRVAVGDEVQEGAALVSVGWPGLFRRQVQAPFNGVIQAITEGHIFIRREPQVYRLRAYVPGEVVERYPHHGVAIRTPGAFVRGIWGSGPEQQGVLMVMVGGAAEPLTWDRVSLHYRGGILVGGTLDDSRVLYRAHRFRLRGLIVGSIAPALRPLCQQLNLPVVVTEGMGNVPMDDPIFDLLLSCHGRPAILSGTDRNGHSGPEVIIPLPDKVDAASTALMVVRPIEVGTLVRLTRPPYMGVIARVAALPPMPQKTALGTRAEGAEVRLPDGRKEFVPFVNMELFE